LTLIGIGAWSLIVWTVGRPQTPPAGK
jgi:hypothetical protein